MTDKEKIDFYSAQWKTYKDDYDYVKNNWTSGDSSNTDQWFNSDPNTRGSGLQSNYTNYASFLEIKYLVTTVTDGRQWDTKGIIDWNDTIDSKIDLWKALDDYKTNGIKDESLITDVNTEGWVVPFTPICFSDETISFISALQAKYEQ